MYARFFIYKKIVSCYKNQEDALLAIVFGIESTNDQSGNF
jgi:hypothetical protein